MSLDLGSMPLIEMTGNRRIVIEGSTGILLYESECIKINTNKMVISFSGRGLCVKCITSSCVEVAGFITGIEFMT
jgi:sporulation protein YqfC